YVLVQKKAACIARYIRFMNTNFNDMVQDGSLKLESSNEKIPINVDCSQNDILDLLQKVFNTESTESIQALAKIVSSSSDVQLPEQYNQS
ncbi:unnamed protein product, partial [Adineta steineri]